VGFLVGIALGVLSALAAAPALADFTVRLLG
jgi:hypothetical protein